MLSEADAMAAVPEIEDRSAERHIRAAFTEQIAKGKSATWSETNPLMQMPEADLP